MSFRMRIVLMALTLILALFSVGSAILIHITFNTSLKKEEQASVKESEMILNTVKMVEERGGWFTEYDLIALINKTSNESNGDSYRLIQDSNTSYLKNEEVTKYFNQVTVTDRKKATVSYFQNNEGKTYLQTTTRFYLNGKKYLLDIGRNLEDIYQMREKQQETYQKIFLILLVVGTVFSWGLAGLVTKPLRRLMKATNEIGAGNFSYRTGINGDDEISILAQKFDEMAGQIENDIEQLKASAEQQEMFVGAFTHEIKTPMTSILGYADLLRTQKLNAKDTEDALNYIFTEAKRLEHLSLKMLELFDVDKKQLVLSKNSPSYLINHVVEHLKIAYASLGIILEVQAEEGTCLLESDLFQSLLINLLENAKKAINQNGKILIELKMTDTGCKLLVRDTGDGIPEESLKHLTEAFYRVDKARARSTANVGLGLALCEKIVQLHHGKIEFESKVKEGTTVTVLLNGGRYGK